MSVRSLEDKIHALVKHWGPGNHPGTGTPQTIHAPGGGLSAPDVASHLTERHADLFSAFPNPPTQFVDPEDGTLDHDAYRFINEVQDAFKENEDLEAQWSDSIDELYDDLRAITDANERDLLIRLATNEITPEQAIERGISQYSQEIRDLGELPDTVYHVTTDTSSVLETGLKARDELAQAEGVGLGGGTANTISFTADEEIAHGILRGMQERHAVLNDPQTHIPRLIEEAKAGTDADRPWWDRLETKWGGEKADVLSNGGVEALLNRESIYVASMGHKTAEEVRAYFDDSRISYWRDKYDLDSIELLKPAGQIGERAVFKVGYTDAGYAEAVGDFMDEFAVFRESAGGHLDPLFISNDDFAFKNKDADDFSIIKGDTIEGAKGYQMSALGEWRTWTGDVLADIEAIR